MHRHRAVGKQIAAGSVAVAIFRMVLRALAKSRRTIGLKGLHAFPLEVFGVTTGQAAVTKGEFVYSNEYN